MTTDTKRWTNWQKCIANIKINVRNKGSRRIQTAQLVISGCSQKSSYTGLKGLLDFRKDYQLVRVEWLSALAQTVL